jgi:hypothetical protein
MRDYINASHRNKKFITSIINSLDQLNAAEFIKLFVQVNDPAVYKIAKGEFFPQAKLLSEIAENSSFNSLTKDHAEIIIQALYTAPRLENVAKSMAMMLVGGTLGYAEFQRVFGEQGDLKPDVLDGDERYEFQERLNQVFAGCAAQSTDVRILIDKLKCLEFVLDAKENSDRVGMFTLNHYKFDPESFFKFYDCLNENQKRSAWLRSQAPHDLYESGVFAKMVAGGYIPHKEFLHTATLKSYTNDDAVTFNTLLPHVVTMNNVRRVFNPHFLNDFERAVDVENLSEKQAQMKQTFNEKVAQLRSQLIVNSNIMPNRELEEFVFDLLIQAYKNDNPEDFCSIVNEVNASKSERRLKTLNAAFEHLYAGATAQLNDKGVTQNTKTMIQAITDCITGRIEDIKAMFENAPTVTEQERKKHKRVDEVCGPGGN